jgi:site-specific recombinase XerD
MRVAMRIQDALEEFVLVLEGNGRSRHTIDQYRRHVRALISWLAPEEDVAAITPTSLAKFLASPAARETRKGRERRPGSVNAMRGSLKGFCAFLHEAGHLPTNPARLIRRARCGSPPPRYLTAEEQAQLLKTLRREEGAAGRDYALVHLLLSTGLRIGSALGLQVEDLDLARGEAVVRTTKGDRPAVVVLGKEIAKHMGWFTADRTRGPLFQGVCVRHARRRVRYWTERAGIRTSASCHTLRHSFGMRVYQATGDLLLTQAALGHASIQSTAVYARADRERLRGVLEAKAEVGSSPE